MQRLLFFLLLTLSVASEVYGQDTFKPQSSWDVVYTNGAILEHNPDIAHLIQGRNQIIILRYNQKTFGLKEWQQRYNYPDWGFTAVYQDLGNPVLGTTISALGHFNFYFLKRSLIIGAGGGLAYNTNPYDADRNFRNIAYGSHIMGAINANITYRKERLIGPLGVEAGIYFIHHSNGKLRAPNTSTNVLSFGFGINYADTPAPFLIDPELPISYKESWAFNVQVHGGANEISVLDRGRNPFYGIQAFMDKRFSYKSSLQVGAEWFGSQSIKEFINYRAIAFPEEGLTGDEASSRLGVFAGYELRISEVAPFAHLGYYIYYPVKYESRVYNRLGIKRYFGTHTFGSIAIKAHAAKAEAIEFGVGYRL